MCDALNQNPPEPTDDGVGGGRFAEFHDAVYRATETHRYNADGLVGEIRQLCGIYEFAATQPTTPEGPTDKPCPTCGGKREVEVPQDGTHDGVWFAPAPCPGCSAPGVREGEGLEAESLLDEGKRMVREAELWAAINEIPVDCDEFLDPTRQAFRNLASQPATPVREDEGLAAENVRGFVQAVADGTMTVDDAELMILRHVERWIRNAIPAPPSPETGQDGWQPIETAPKDGTWILIWGEQWSGAPIPDVGHWDDDDWRDDEHTVLAFATHWMPLPAPPSEGSKS